MPVFRPRDTRASQRPSAGLLALASPPPETAAGLFPSDPPPVCLSAVPEGANGSRHLGPVPSLLTGKVPPETCEGRSTPAGPDQEPKLARGTAEE